MFRAPRCWILLVAALMALGAALAERTEEDVILTLSAHSYALGDLVEFSVQNNSDSTLTFTSQPPFEIRSTATGEVVFPVVTLPMETYLHPRESTDFEWDQHYDPVLGGGQVPPGEYRLTLGFWYGTHATGWWGTCVDSFEIRDDSPADPATWGRIKGLWR